MSCFLKSCFLQLWDVVEHSSCIILYHDTVGPCRSSCTLLHLAMETDKCNNGLILFPQSRNNFGTKWLTRLPVQYHRKLLFPMSPANQSMLRTSVQSFLLLWPYPVVSGRCGIALDAWMLPVGDDIYQNSVQQPLLFINSEKFQWADNILKMKKLSSNDTNKKMITIK